MTQQTEPTTRRGVVLYPANPFMEAGLVKSKNQAHHEQAGRDDGDGRQWRNRCPCRRFLARRKVDSAKFIKLYVNGVKAFKDLKGPGTKVFELLYLEMQRNIATDRVFMSFSAVDQNISPISMATYKRGMAELIAKGFWLQPPSKAGTGSILISCSTATGLLSFVSSDARAASLPTRVRRHCRSQRVAKQPNQGRACCPAARGCGLWPLVACGAIK